MRRRFGDGLAAGLAALILAIAIFFTTRYAINADDAAMLSLARRLLAGGHFGVDIADTNPPLSILAYLPAALLAKCGVPGWLALELYIIALIGVSAGLVHRLLARADFAPPPQRTLILYLYILANFLIPGPAFGERDHIVLLGLLPLLLAQAALQIETRLPRGLLFVSLAAGAIAICLKPHYLLAPMFMVVWRCMKQPRARTLLRADVFVLASTALVYAALLAFVFADYLHLFLPDVVALYARQVAVRPFPNWLPLLLALAAFAAARFCFRDGPRAFYTALALAALANYGAYVLQMKGYAYHLIPCGIFLFVAGGAMIADLARKPALIAAAAGVLLLLLYPVHPAYPTHATYATLPLAQIVKTECGGSPCAFLVDNEFQFMTDETALYTGTTSASRFPAFWFESPLACGQRPDLFDKYAGMLAADLRRWRPVFIALAQSPLHCQDGRTIQFEFGAFYARDPAFAAEWSHYKFERTDSFNRRVYFRGTGADYDHTMTFAIYRRTTP